MRAIPLTLTALAAALALTACDNGGGSGTGGSESKAGAACAAGSVSLQVGSASVAPAAGDSGQVPVSITNQSAPCVLDHFPGVTLHQGGRTEKLPVQEGATAQKLKLAKGDSASFTISYVRGADAGAKDAKGATVEITLPGGGEPQSFPWKYGPVAAKAGKTTPDASVSAFQQVGD
ncbi:DUF4232 domain-containing protein [Streptomyces sp. NPDC003656]|uniref:DUF4232 domain-containing protein n=1 Tax=Streptomyces sp. DSM 110735 TaxID=2775031 RepID=UPI0018F74F1C|nr:DUF4232 domain-containing protein [Streptomyces sp. DSM 110735]MBJ7906795.1 DUF4232 domain-containing protein [Streptomyces sp. DSM 110735]